MRNTPIELVMSKLPGARPNGKGWSARCPAHEDRRPSLSIAEGDDGRALVRCHAGCTVDAICAAVGLRVADLTPADAVDVDTTSRKPRKNGVSSTSTLGNGRQRAFQTARDAVAELERRHGKRSALWTYHDAQGEPVGVIVRWDRPHGKDIRPVARNGDGWIVGGMPEPRPLYRLPELADAKRVYVTEGEPCVEAARSLGLVATTSPHGAKGAGKADWSPLAGKDVVILPNNDPPGRAYADSVGAILKRQKPATAFKVVDLPGLPEGGDIVDWIGAHGDAAEPDELRRQVETLADEAEPVEMSGVAHSRPAMLSWRPFPVEALPEPVRGFVTAGAKAIGCDPSYLALPMLAVLAAAIGNARRVQLKRGWTARPILWTAIVGESGTAKTPAFKLAMRPIQERQRKALERHAEAVRKHEANMAWWEKGMAEWKREKKATGDPPEKPEAPQPERCVVSDTTVEALAPLLAANPRGLLLSRDELAGWIGSFDRYAGGKGGADAAHWLSMHSGESIVVDRKTGNLRTIFVPQASVCVTGGIQPAILHRALGIEHRESGLAARLLLTCPPSKAKRWTEADIDPAAEAEIARLARVGLIDTPRATLLGPFLDGYIDQKRRRGDVTDSTIEVWGHTRRNLIGYFGTNKDMRAITPADADDWAAWLRTDQHLAENTIRKRSQFARKFFSVAIQRKLIPENPFRGLVGTVVSVPERQFFITREMVDALLDQCHGPEYRLLVIMARYLGVRIPSEIVPLTWRDVDWENLRIVITSPKTKRHKGGAKRVCPIFPEMLPALQEAYHAAPEGAVWIFPSIRTGEKNLRTWLERAIVRAGLTPWPRLWQNFRATRATELADQYPSHVAAAWLGHTERIADRHYRQTTGTHYERAIREPSGPMPGQRENPAQKPAQYPHELGRKEWDRQSKNPQDTRSYGPLPSSAHTPSGGQGTRTLNRQAGT